MKKIIPFLMALLLLAGCGARSEESTYRQVNAEEAATMMEEESSSIILDVRTTEEYSEKHIPGSKNVPLQSLDKGTGFVNNQDTPVSVCCHSGARSAQAVSVLKGMGYTNVKNIGGIAAYAGKVEH